MAKIAESRAVQLPDNRTRHDESSPAHAVFAEQVGEPGGDAFTDPDRRPLDACRHIDACEGGQRVGAHARRSGEWVMEDMCRLQRPKTCVGH